MEQKSKVLTPEEFSRVLHLESEGNASSAASEWDTAEDYYKKAIAIFESRTCVTYTGIEREKLVELLSNRSATLFKRQAFVQSEIFASKCLYLHPGHDKASYQRAMTRLHISQRKQLGDAQRIGWALEDVRKCKPGEATKKLEEQLRDETWRIQKYEHQQNRMGFGNSYNEAMGNGGNGDTVMIENSSCRTNEAGYVA